jgi:3-oxoacyl-[acyl-carrier protein] reductase
MSERGGVAIVTGASRGSDQRRRAIAAAGYVAVNYRDRERDARWSEIARAGDRRGRQADVGQGGRPALVRAALTPSGRSTLVNNAGVHLPGSGADVPPDAWERVLRVNLSGPFHLIQAVLPHMRARRTGHIVNLSSNVTQRFPVAAGPYTVSKIGLEALTRVLAKEEGRHGIRVNAVAPGPIETDMLDESLTAMGSERAAAFIASVPLGRKGRPEEIAGVVRFLVSDAASYLTGQVLYVNGGGPGG